MLNPNLFLEEKIKESQAERALLTLLNLDKINNTILRVDTKEESVSSQKYLLNADDALSVAGTLSSSQEKNVFVLNETFNENLKNLFSNLKQNFQKLYFSLYSFPSSLLLRGVSVSILNIISGDRSSLSIRDQEMKNDVALLRNFGKINIFLPADANELEYLLKINEKGFYKNQNNNLSYYRIKNIPTVAIFKKDYFIKENNLKEWTGMPDIVYISKNIDSAFSISIISSGSVLYEALQAAKELEDRNYKVTVLNMSLISSNSEYINQKIKSFIQNFAEHNKNILTVEEHSKIGGLGSLIAETIAEKGKELHARVERLGLEDDISSQNIISKAEEISGF